MIRVFFHTCLCVFLLSRQASSQHFDFSFDHILNDKGLSNEMVTTIASDAQGFIWFGTEDGLNRYDGRSFRVYRHDRQDSLSLPSNFINHICATPEGDLWVSTNRGLCRMKPGTKKFYMVPFPGNERNSGSLVSRLECTPDGFIWFIHDRFLYKMKRADYSYQRFEIPTREFFFGVYLDKKNRVWLQLRSSIYRFDEATRRFTYYGGMNNLNPSEKLLLSNPIPANSDTVFLGSYGLGILYYDEKKDKFLKWKKSEGLITAALEDHTPSGHRFFWCLGGETGLMIYDPAADRYHPMMNNPRDPYSHNGVDGVSLFKDQKSGTVWIGTKGGIEKFDPYSHRFRRKYMPEEIKFGGFALFGEVIKDETDRSGNTYWAGSWAMGLFKWNRDQNQFKSFNTDHGLISNEVFHILQCRDGNLVISSKDGITFFDPRKETVIKKVKGFIEWPMSPKIIYSMEDRNGDIWMSANYDGIFQYIKKTGRVRRWALPGVRPEDGPFTIAQLHEDSLGRVWVSGFKGELFRIDAGREEVVVISDQNRKGKKLEANVVGLHINRSRNRIYVSGKGNYLAELDMNGEVKFILYDRSRQDASGYFMILEDNGGFVWASDGTNINRIDPRTGHRDVFSKDDGLISNTGIYGASMTSDGELFLGYQYAFSHIQTGNIAFNTRKPEVGIANAFINYKEVDDLNSTSFVLRPSDKVISLEFAALDYSQPLYHQFAYLLEGYDKDWQYTRDHDITLMNLDGGTHYLLVRATNNDGAWSDPLRISIRVIPPFYKTLFFKILIALVICLLAYLVMMYRKEQVKRLERVRQRIATDLHDDMGSTLSSIRIFSDVARKQVETVQPETLPLLDRISTNATSLSENMQDIIWTIRSDNDTLEDLVSRMREFGLRVCDAKGIRFLVKISRNFRPSRLSLEQRRNLYLIFKESLNNAVKYSQCTEITLFMTQQGRYLKMEIIDNGKGFQPEQVKKGNGLNNLEKRAREINGQLELVTGPGKGTRVDLLVTLKKSSLKG